VSIDRGLLRGEGTADAVWRELNVNSELG